MQCSDSSRTGRSRRSRGSRCVRILAHALARLRPIAQPCWRACRRIALGRQRLDAKIAGGRDLDWLGLRFERIGDDDGQHLDGISFVKTAMRRTHAHAD